VVNFGPVMTEVLALVALARKTPPHWHRHIGPSARIVEGLSLAARAEKPINVKSSHGI